MPNPPPLPGHTAAQIRSGSVPSIAAIVIGSGISGLFVALEARRLGPVLVLTKGSIDDCNTRWAQGGIAAAIGPLDTPQQHLADTIAAGAGLVDEEAARLLCEEAPARIQDLVQYGVSFDSLGSEVRSGERRLTGETRILHAGGDRTGAAIETALSFSTQQAEITVFDYTLATRAAAWTGRVTGRRGARPPVWRGRGHTNPTRVVLATGGAGQLFRTPRTRKSRPATGSRSPSMRAPRSRTWSSTSSTPRRCGWTAHRHSSSPKRCGAKAPCCETSPAKPSCGATTPWRISRRAMS